jgi:hypothetical protein
MRQAIRVVQAVTVSVTSGTPPRPRHDATERHNHQPDQWCRVSGMVNVKVSASDNVAVSSLSLSIDGKSVATSNQSSITYKWSPSKGSHTISVVARDPSGNQATKTIQVTR